MSDNERILIGLRESRVPFTYRFLGLRLRLAFTKRRFCQVEQIYRKSLLTDRGRLDDLANILQSSFSSLHNAIERIEEGQENIKQRALPKVKEQLVLHHGFICFLSGFIEGKDDCSVQDNFHRPQRQCHLPLLNQGEETDTAFKKLIAEFAGVPIGMLVHDLRTLEGLLEQKEAGQGSMVEELETPIPVKQEEISEVAL
jgi:hypothetical protein